MEFYFPTEPGEQLAFFAAAAGILLGLALMLGPRIIAGDAGFRAEGGMLAGLGAACLLFAQPMLYLGFSAALVAAALGLLVALAVTPGGRARLSLLLVAHLALAAPPALYVLAMV